MRKTPDIPCGRGEHYNFGRNEDGRPILAEVSGPMTVLESCLAPAFKLWRKHSPLMHRILDSIGGELLQKIAKLKENGVKIISYADPVGTEAILGPKFSAALAKDFLLPFLKRAEPLLEASIIMHLCPQTTHLLTTLGFAEWRPLSLSRPITYGEACLACRDRVKFVGQMCLQKGGLLLKDGIIQEFCVIYNGME